MIELGECHITVKEAAREMGVSDRYVRRLCARQWFSAVQSESGEWQIAADSFRDWLAECRQGQEAERLARQERERIERENRSERARKREDKQQLSQEQDDERVKRLKEEILRIEWAKRWKEPVKPVEPVVPAVRTIPATIWAAQDVRPMRDLLPIGDKALWVLVVFSTLFFLSSVAFVLLVLIR